VGAQDQFLEGVIGAGAVVAGVNAHRGVHAAQLAPVADIASEQARDLIRAKRADRVVRMHDDGQPVDGDDLFGGRAAEVAQPGESLALAGLDRA